MLIGPLGDELRAVSVPGAAGRCFSLPLSPPPSDTEAASVGASMCRRGALSARARERPIRFADLPLLRSALPCSLPTPAQSPHF